MKLDSKPEDVLRLISELEDPLQLLGLLEEQEDKDLLIFLKGSIIKFTFR